MTLSDETRRVLEEMLREVESGLVALKKNHDIYNGTAFAVVSEGAIVAAMSRAAALREVLGE